MMILCYYKPLLLWVLVLIVLAEVKSVLYLTLELIHQVSYMLIHASRHPTSSKFQCMQEACRQLVCLGLQQRLV